MAFFKFPKRKLRKLIQQGEYEMAIEFGNSLASKFSQDSDYLFIMGSIFYIVEDEQKALDYFDRSLNLNPDDIETLELKANMHLRLKENESVMTCCKKILAQNPRHIEAQQILDTLENNNNNNN